MQSSEKLCLKWNDFQENLNSAFGVLRNDEDFADVTLVSEDGTQIETHKVLLASLSPFFMELLKKNKHPHPLIYLRGVKANELVAMIEFLYFGEAYVYQENLDDLLVLAEEFQLKGLTGSSNQHTKGKDNKTKATKRNKNYGTKENDEERTAPAPTHEYNREIKTEPSSVALVSTEAHQLDEQIKSMMTTTANEITIGQQTRKAYACTVCGKEAQRINIMNHIEAKHIDNNISHPCDICGKIYKTREILRKHKTKDGCKLFFTSVDTA